MAKKSTDNQNLARSTEGGHPIQPEIGVEMDEGTNQRIRSRAYEIWQAEGSLDGRHEDHWLQAEHEILHAGEPFDGHDVPNLAAVREAARQHTDAFIVASDLEDADQREATPAVREQP